MFFLFLHDIDFCSYKVAFTKLKSLKTEIEHLQHLLEMSKVQLQKDFENWWTETATLQSLSNQVCFYEKIQLRLKVVIVNGLTTVYRRMIL